MTVFGGVWCPVHSFRARTWPVRGFVEHCSTLESSRPLAQLVLMIRRCPIGYILLRLRYVWHCAETDVSSPCFDCHASGGTRLLRSTRLFLLFRSQYIPISRRRPPKQHLPYPPSKPTSLPNIREFVFRLFEIALDRLTDHILLILRCSMMFRESTIFHLLLFLECWL